MFDVVVADEVQRIKNPRAGITKAARGIPAGRRWGLTGTPLENRLEDLASVFNFVRPGLFHPDHVPGLSLPVIRSRIGPLMLRRRKEDALPELPKKVVDTKWLELEESQRRSYDRAEGLGVDRLKATPDITVQHILALIQQLKQICNFDPVTRESCKMEFLTEEFLPEACQDGDKVLIFSQYVKSLEQIEPGLRDYSPLAFTGQLSVGQRERIVEAFQTDDDHRVLLLSLKAGGLGLNLTRANYVLHFDRWWNPAVEHQAEDRVHRIDQTKPVFVTRLICEDTIEEQIDELLEQKKMLFREAVDELSDVSLDRVLSEEELFGLFGLTSPRQRGGGEVGRISKSPVSAARAESTPQGATAAFSSDARIRQIVRGSRAAVIKPGEPFSNLVALRGLIRECEDYIWWVDRYFNARGLEELIVSVDPANVREIRILSGADNVDTRAKRDFVRFCEELTQKGITAEWRILKAFAHDRFIISQNGCFNVPSIDTIVRGQYSEILETPHRPPFDDWWSKAESIGDLTS